MPKKTLALISGLVLVTFILFVIALNNNKTNLQAPAALQQNTQESTSANLPVAQTSLAQPQAEQNYKNSELTISPNPVIVNSGQEGTVAVNIDTSDNDVTAIQLEVAYDPNYITNVKVSPGALFANPVILINKNTVKDGRYTYAFGIIPNNAPVKGVGNVANITFTALNKAGDTQLALLPTTLVTARGISNSVLKLATGTLISIK